MSEDLPQPVPPRPPAMGPRPPAMGPRPVAVPAAVKHYKTVILVNDLGLLDGKPDANAAANGYPQGKTVYQKPAETEIDDSSIPF